MENSGQQPDNDVIKKLQSAINSLAERVKIIEDRLNIPVQNNIPASFTKETVPDEIKVDWENLTGASQLGWLAIIVTMIGLGFFIRFMFIQEWITGSGQPVTLCLSGIVIIAVSDYLSVRNHKKFSIMLTVCGYIILYLSLYWAAIYLKLVPLNTIIFGSLIIWIGSLIWGFKRDSSLLPIWGFIGAGFLPLLILSNQIFGNFYVIYCNLLIIICIFISVKKDWNLFPVVGTLIGHITLLSAVRHFFESSHSDNYLTIGIVSTVPGLLILWSGLVHILNKRKQKIIEIFIWIFNNIFLYAGIKNLSGKLDAPLLLIIPIVCNGLLYYLFKKTSIDAKYNRPYLTGLVVSAAIAFTILIPAPLDIISICLFSVFLAYLGDRKHEWDFKALSGLMVIWSLIFLFSFRFTFTSTGEIPFVNISFISFIIAFLCFGYQGKMINSDPSAGKAGPLLGQGLFSLGLLVLLSGISGEFLHLFPPDDNKIFSEKALLAITIAVAGFSFIVTYIGLILKLFFIRLLALGMFIILISKMIFLDLIVLRPVFLIASLAIVGILLGGASILLKKSMSKKVKNRAENDQN